MSKNNGRKLKGEGARNNRAREKTVAKIQLTSAFCKRNWPWETSDSTTTLAPAPFTGISCPDITVAHPAVLRLPSSPCARKVAASVEYRQFSRPPSSRTLQTPLPISTALAPAHSLPKTSCRNSTLIPRCITSAKFLVISVVWRHDRVAGSPRKAGKENGSTTWHVSARH